MIRSYLLVVPALLSIMAGFCQDIGIPPIKNFSPEEYSAEPQNWQISQGKDGIMYVANNSGLLEFDGVSWKLIEMPKSIARSVDIAHDGNVYVGAVGNLGYIHFDEEGRHEFVSLLDKIPVQYHDFVDVWRTSTTQDGVYFKTNKYIFLWDGEKITTWSAPKFFAFSFVVGNDFYVKEDSLGLLCFRNKKLQQLPSSVFFKGKDIRSILEFSNAALLVSTLEHGMFLYFYDGNIKPFKTDADDFLKKNLLFASCKIRDNLFAFGTFRDGLLLMNSNGLVVKRINEQSGIRENSIRALFLDREGGLWLGLNNGVSRIEVNSPTTLFDKRIKIKGSVYQVNRLGKTLYVGTSVGLNYLDGKTGELRPFENFADQVWNLFSIGDSQLMGTNSSSYLLQNYRLTLINNSGGSLTYLRSRQDANRVFVGLRDGLQTLYKTKRGWKVEANFNEVTGQVKSMVEDADGSLWVVTNLLGIVRLNFSSSREKPSLEFFDGIDNRNELIELNNEVLVFSNGVFYQINTTKKVIEKKLQVLGDPVKTKNLHTLTRDANGNIIAWSSSAVGYLRKKDQTTYVLDESPFLRIRDKAINFVFPDGDSLVWVCSANGLYRVDIKKESKPFDKFETKIRTVSEIDHDSVAYGADKKARRFDHSLNDLRFQFAALFFDRSDETEYQTFLKGSDLRWSNWSKSTKKDYTNLWEGDYTFHVRSRNIYQSLGTEATYAFTILPPWYRTNSAYALYAIGVIAFFYSGVRMYYTNLKRANKRLEMLIEKRTARINQQKEEIQSQRDNLVQAHQTIEQQNDTLLRMNHELEKIVEERTSALTKTNYELTEVNKELDRFVYRAAHDLRGPIATLLGLCRLSLMETKDASTIEYLSKIQLTAERMNLLLFMLLKINRIKTTEINARPIEISAVTKNMVDHLMATYQSNAEISVSIDPSIDMTSDPDLINIILENLIDNSLKFRRPDVEPVISIEVKKAGDRVNILVTDNGIGVQKEYQNKIFDMFFIGTAERKGMGLGLHAVQMAARKLKGTVKLVDTGGPLTQFLVDIQEKI